MLPLQLMVVSTFFKIFTTKNLIQKCILRIICIQFSSSISSSSSCAELMCLMLKGSRVCKTQGRSYPPPPQMEYCVCVYEFTNSWRAGTLTADASQLCSFKPKQAASLDTQGLGRRTKCPIKGDPAIYYYSELMHASCYITAYRQTTTLKHFQNGPSSLA